MSTSYDYFDRMYQDPDPWSFASSPYERRKYDLTVGSLPRSRYRRAFEPGCSIGVLTRRLAGRVDELVAVDLHAAPLVDARRRLAASEGIVVQQMAVPGEWPAGTFDLIVLSEIAYYFDDEDLALLQQRVAETLEPGGDLVLVHWRGETDYPQSGDAVHERWLTTPGFAPFADHREERFRIDVLSRTGRPTEARP